MQQFNDLLRDIRDNGRESSNRTATRTKKVFGRQLRFNLADGFPLVTCRKIFTKGIFKELEWFIGGITSNAWLNEQGVKIWNQWALTETDLDKLSALPYRSVDRYDLYMEKVRIEKGEDAAKAEKDRFNGTVTGIKNALTSAEGKAVFDEAGIPEFKSYRDLGYKVGDLGPVYGKQWVDWISPDGSHINQLKECEELLKTKPLSRRIIVSAWNPADLPDESVSPQQNVLNGKMALAACHTMFQFFADEASILERAEHLRYSDSSGSVEVGNTVYLTINKLLNPITEKTILRKVVNFVKGLFGIKPPTIDQLLETKTETEKGGVRLSYREWAELLLGTTEVPKLRLSLQLYQRSLDLPIGGPFNIASYAALTHIFANVANMIPGEFVWATGDTHFYLDQLECIEEQLTRNPKPLPRLRIKRKLESVFDFTAEDLELIGYAPHDSIKYPDPAV